MGKRYNFIISMGWLLGLLCLPGPAFCLELDASMPVISHSESYRHTWDINKITDRTSDYRMDAARGCLSVKTKETRGGSDVIPVETQEKTVDPERCRHLEIQASLIQALGQCPKKSVSIDGPDWKVTQNEGCLCQQEYIGDFRRTLRDQVRTAINPLNIFNGPAYSSRDEYRMCNKEQWMAMMDTPDQKAAVEEAFQRH